MGSVSAGKVKGGKKEEAKGKVEQQVEEEIVFPDSFPQGEGPKSGNKRTRLITFYGPGKVRKTSNCVSIHKAIWLANDPNCLQTLEAAADLGIAPMPPKNWIHTGATSLIAQRTRIAQLLEHPEVLAKLNAVICDSFTKVADWHKQDVAEQTGQAFIGEDPKSQGWQRFNADMFGLIDDYVALSKIVNVILITHGAEKFELKNGEFNALALPNQVSNYLIRNTNWLLFCTMKEEKVKEGKEEVLKPVTKIYTQPNGSWPASVGSANLEPCESNVDLAYLMRKDRLIP